MPEIPAPRRWEQEVLEFKASLAILTLPPQLLTTKREERQRGQKTERREMGRKGGRQ